MVQSVITGDVINSRSIHSKRWGDALQEALSLYASEFDIFRGDSFQAIVPIDKTIEICFYLKARLHMINQLDVRVGIGIGEIEHKASNVKKSSGDVFVRSGAALDSLKKESLRISTPWPDIDERLNLILELTTEISDRWTVNMAESIAVAIQNPTMNQKDLAKKLNRKHQSQVSTELTKAGYLKIQKVIAYCTKEIMERC